jgi:hypothetical protein
MATKSAHRSNIMGGHIRHAVETSLSDHQPHNTAYGGRASFVGQQSLVSCCLSRFVLPHICRYLGVHRAEAQELEHRLQCIIIMGVDKRTVFWMSLRT